MVNITHHNANIHNKSIDYTIKKCFKCKFCVGATLVEELIFLPYNHIWKVILHMNENISNLDDTNHHEFS
jgi:hypothetical protein